MGWHVPPAIQHLVDAIWARHSPQALITRPHSYSLVPGRHTTFIESILTCTALPANTFLRTRALYMRWVWVIRQSNPLPSRLDVPRPLRPSASSVPIGVSLFHSLSPALHPMNSST